MNELTGRLVKEYQLDGRKANDWAPSTEKSMMTTIRVFIRWCEGIEAVESGLSERVQPRQFPATTTFATSNLTRRRLKKF